MVVDTNVVVSAILRDRLPEKVLLFIVARPDFEWVASPEILAEYRAVLRRQKFALPDSVLLQWDERFNSAIAEWPVEIPVSFPRDVKDAKFLACALAAGAKVIVSRDDDLLALKKPFGIQIVTPRELLSKLARPL